MQLAELALGGRSWTAPSLFISPRMGGGPRTYPGGVSKWQWKKMQDKKSKQILKARLIRERELYEMRKRAELKSADLSKPWERTQTTRAPTLFSVTADDQLQAMADRFVKRGAIDLWTDKDGPLSNSAAFITQDGKPSARVFPQHALYSTKPYTLASPHPPAQNPNGHSSNPSPSSPSRPPPSHSRDSKPRRGKSMVARSISVLSSMSGGGNYNDGRKTKENQKVESVKDKWQQRHRFLSSPEPPHADGQDYSNKTKENHNVESVKDKWQRRHRFLSSPEPPHADGQDYSNKTKEPVPKSARHTFAGFNLAKRSTQRLKEASSKSKTVGDSGLQSYFRTFTA